MFAQLGTGFFLSLCSADIDPHCFTNFDSMNHYEYEHIEAIDMNRREFGERYHEMHWLRYDEADSALDERSGLLQKLESLGVKKGYLNSKLDTNNLSPGCKNCGDGTWSCLFINGICNSRCFYCPAPQNDTGVPTTNTVHFYDPEDYIDYIKLFGFKGVSISGGEPLLSADRSEKFIKSVTQFGGDNIHTWLYTNGKLVTQDILRKLRDAGLKEIRFDIGAVNYNTDKVEMAIGIIPIVTIEIPAVPEEYERLQILIPRMAGSGLAHLNLHQLRATLHNVDNLIQRGYTFLHGKRATVLESEMTALQIIKFVRENNIELPVNYCSFVYKHRYQRMAALRRYAEKITESYEDITGAGFIRRIWVEGSEDELQVITKDLKNYDPYGKTWKWNKADNRVFIGQQAICSIDPDKTPVYIAYDGATIRQSNSGRNKTKEIKLNDHRSIFIERNSATPEFSIRSNSWDIFKRTFLMGTGSLSNGMIKERIDYLATKSPRELKHDPWYYIVEYEHLKENLGDYY